MPRNITQEILIFENWARGKPRSVIGGLVKEYVAESNASGWDGFAPSQVVAICKFLHDMKQYCEAEDNLSYFRDTITNVNPVP